MIFLIFFIKKVYYSILFIIGIILFDTKFIYYPNFFLPNRIYINPIKIKYIASIPFKPKFGTPVIIDLDKYVKNISDALQQNYKAISARQIIQEHIKIENTLEFQKMLDDGMPYKNVFDYMQSIELMYSQFQNLNFNEPIRDKFFTPGIEVGLGKEGDLVKVNSGNHRFFGSYFSQINNIPVSLCLFDKNFFEEYSKKNGRKGWLMLRSFLKKKAENLC